MAMLLPKGRKVGRIVKPGARWRSKAHLDHVRAQRCCVPGCFRQPVEAHHPLKGPERKARGMKASDHNALPLCGGPDGGHHRGQDSPHHDGDEDRWMERHGIDRDATIERLQQSSPVAGAIATHLRGNA